MKNSWRFFWSWLRTPRTIGAITPSGKALGRAIARQIDIDTPGMIIELGGGTGSLTEALLAIGLPPERLVVIERNPTFYDILHEQFPKVNVVLEDATNLQQLVVQRQFKPINAIVSGLPLLSLDPKIRDQIISQVLQLLNGSNAFYQFTYGSHSPVPEYLLAQTACEVSRIGRIWRNFPPATVWRYKKIKSEK